MKTEKAVIIRANGNTENIRLPMDSINKGKDRMEAIHKALGGWYETVYSEDRKSYMYIDEEGRLKGLPSNELATNVLDIGAGILGDVVLVGPAILDLERTAEFLAHYHHSMKNDPEFRAFIQQNNPDWVKGTEYEVSK